MRTTFLGASLLWLAACGDDAEDPAPQPPLDASAPDASSLEDAGNDAARDAAVPFVCDVQAPTSCPDPAPTFADVQPIFVNECGACHGQDWTGEWPLRSYTHIADWQDEIRSELVSCGMPPPESGIQLDPEKRMRILNWLRCGLPR